ncbi:MAG: hypothetical protein IPP19_13535 [Verrucomicrobia bacterium]|nr:hypothetical protein [Verrucomicrobiota bacterium]
MPPLLEELLLEDELDELLELELELELELLDDELLELEDELDELELDDELELEELLLEEDELEDELGVFEESPPPQPANPRQIMTAEQRVEKRWIMVRYK